MDIKCIFWVWNLASRGNRQVFWRYLPLGCDVRNLEIFWIENTYWIQLSYDLKICGTRRRLSTAAPPASSIWKTLHDIIFSLFQLTCRSHQRLYRMRVLSFGDLWTPKLAPLELPMRPEKALQGYSESIIDGQAFSINLEILFTLLENHSNSWINVPLVYPSSRIINRLNRGQIFPTYIFLTLNSKKNEDEAANSSSNELHVSTRNTLPSTASHKDQYSRH